MGPSRRFNVRASRAACSASVDVGTLGITSGRNAALAGFVPAPAFAQETGITGQSTSGCRACHGSSADPSTTVTFSAPSSTVYPGDTVAITLTVSTTSASHTHAGLDVSATGGSLHAGSNDHLSFGEITHANPQPMVVYVVAFACTWTAPTVEGTYTLRGAGNAVNHDAGDGWTLASDLPAYSRPITTKTSPRRLVLPAVPS